MTVSSNCFKDIANSNLNFESEIGYRMAIGRSYYAMFHKLHECMIDYSYAGGGTHKDLTNYLAEQESYCQCTERAKNLKRLRYMMSQAKSQRVIADYERDQTVARTAAQSAIQLSHKFFELAETTFAPETKLSA